MSLSQTPGAWQLAPGTRWLDDHTLAGGTPYRVVTLTPLGAEHIRSIIETADAVATPPAGDAVSALLSRLESSGLLLAPAPPNATSIDVTIVIPARSALAPVARLLDMLPGGVPIVLVDDGSPEPLHTLKNGRENLTVLRHQHSRGPAAARNAGAATVGTAWIAFLDADTEPDPDWISALKGHVDHAEAGAGSDAADTRVVLAAPRIYALRGSGAGAWFEMRVCALDLGGTPTDVGIGLPVSYVPSAAMLVRTSAFRAVEGFDESMQVGEDVDLVWRLARHGRIRYIPQVRVGHAPRGTLTAALRRRIDYGSSAGDLGRRHPGALRHVDVSLWSGGPWALAVAVHPVVGLAAAAFTAAISPWGMRDLSPGHARRLAAQGHLRAFGALGRWLIRPMAPLTILVGLTFPRIGRRLAVSAALGIAYVVALDGREARQSGLTGIGVGRVSAEALVARTLDDLAYSVGVWRGALASRTLEPLLPRVRDLPKFPAGFLGRQRKSQR